MSDLWQHLHWSDAVDVLIVSVLLWLAFAWLRRARARFALVGLVFLGLFFVAAQRLHLELTVRLLQGLSAVVVIVLVIVFQDDLKLLFEQIAVWGLRRRSAAPPETSLGTLVQAVVRLAAARTGALVVLPGRTPLDRHLEGGVELGGHLSEPLLLSLFDAHSPGHDGAVVVDGSRVGRFGVHLPLSNDRDQLIRCGTRHAAALGLAERSDALVVVVSEERGTVSVAHDGELRPLAAGAELADELADELERFYAEQGRVFDPRSGSWREQAARWPEALAALALAGLLWLVFIPGASVVGGARQVPVTVENLPLGYVLESVEPATVEVVFSGPRRRVLMVDEKSFNLRLDALLVELGRRTFQVSPDQVEAPEGLEVEEVRPEKVRLSVRQVPEG